jgi:plasmid maintenance system antidote protein VapI
VLLNNIEVDVKIKCIEKDTTQTMLADGVGTSPSYVSRIVKSKEHIVNKTFIAMMEQLGYDVELTYVKRGDQ